MKLHHWTAFVFGCLFAPQAAFSEIPRCLNGFCIGDVFTVEDSDLPFRLRHQDRDVCPRYQAFLAEIENGNLDVSVNADNGQIFRIERHMFFDAEEQRRSIPAWEALLRQRYGAPSRGPHIDPLHPWWGFTAESAGSAGSDTLFMHVAIALSDEGISSSFPGQIMIDTSLRDPAVFDVTMPDRSCLVDQVLPD